METNRPLLGYTQRVVAILCLHLRAGCPETSVRNYHYSLPNSPEEGRFLLTFSTLPAPILSYENTAQTTVLNCQTLCQFILSHRCVCAGGQTLCQFILSDRCVCAGGQTTCNSAPVPNHQAQYP